jgi:hypothetical protein
MPTGQHRERLGVRLTKALCLSAIALAAYGSGTSAALAKGGKGNAGGTPPGQAAGPTNPGKGNGNAHKKGSASNAGSGSATSSAATTPSSTAAGSATTNSPGIAFTQSAPNATSTSTKPGFGCGDPNHTHTGPPGNAYGANPCSVSQPSGTTPSSSSSTSGGATTSTNLSLTQSPPLATTTTSRPGFGCGDKNHTHTGPPGNHNGTTNPCGSTASSGVHHGRP